MIRGRAMPRAACATAVLLPALLVSAVRAEVANRIVATIDGEPVTAHELRRYAKDHGIGGEPEARIDLEKEGAGQGLDVGQPLAQRRDLQADLGQAVEQVGAEGPGA